MLHAPQSFPKPAWPSDEAIYKTSCAPSRGQVLFPALVPAARLLWCWGSRHSGVRRGAGMCSGGSCCTCRKFSRAQSPCCECSSALGKPSHSCQHSRMGCGALNNRSIHTGGTTSPSPFSHCTSCGQFLLLSGKTQHKGIQPLGISQVAFWELGAVTAWEAPVGCTMSLPL